MRWLLIVTQLLALEVAAQQRVLHFTKTSGFDHGTRAVSFAMFQEIAVGLGAEVDDDATGDTFSDGSALAQYAVIVFSNTSGNALLDAQQQANFEQWVTNGGRVLGIHAATDTYRHSTANGGSTGSWDFYAELMGASVQESPNHVSGTPAYSMEHIGVHPSTTNLPDPWVKNEEYYYWEGGYYGPDNTEVLRVEETVGPNGEVNSYDAPRPMSWHRELPNGSRVFYTALGHATENYTDDALFRKHVLDALVWLLSPVNDVFDPPIPEDLLFLSGDGSLCCPSCPIDPHRRWEFMDLNGRVLGVASSSEQCRPLASLLLPQGIYVFRTQGRTSRFLITD